MLGKPKDNVKSNISKTNFDRQKISSYTNSEDLNIPIYKVSLRSKAAVVK